ncbi:nSTAND1 domain-containing NTPase [Limnospira platensis]|uniref:WD40 domain-containing protein n=1 Tax=Limnospira platensis TaxID=118562 RepID=UPI00028043AA|nr:WD-40 repeat protein [Arthrospira platensis C1]UWU49025.1 WD-40 repeat-containing protein [Arthrospira platensis C1]
MTNQLTPQKFESQNQRSLQRLARAISFSKGQFSLILVSCNYSYLQTKVIKQLREKLPEAETIQTITLSPKVTTLYTTLLDRIATPTPSVLMVMGLDTVEALETLLSSTNQVRDEFRKNFSCPLVLWTTDILAKKLIRLAPDFKSWGAATIKFEMATPDLIKSLTLQGNTLFSLAELRIRSGELQSRKFDGRSKSPKYDLSIGSSRRRELEFAWKDLQHRGVELNLFLQGTKQFIFGLDKDAQDLGEEARVHYQKSLADLENWISPTTTSADPYQFAYPISYQVIRGIILFHIALNDRLKAMRSRHIPHAKSPGTNVKVLHSAKTHLEQSRQAFEMAGRPDLVAGILCYLGDVLKGLYQWEDLQNLAETGIKIHLAYGGDRQLAQDYGFMAEVALQQKKWHKALELTKLALAIIDSEKRPNERGTYLLLLARSHKHLNEWETAIKELEKARQETSPSYDPQLYIDILAELRNLYYEQGQYIKAFRIKQRQREVEHQYGFRAFIGAHQLQPSKQALNPVISSKNNTSKAAISPGFEMTNNSRNKDINNLIHRLGRDDHKLIVLHGSSGVGKSSLINAGLVPAMAEISLGARNVLPVVINSYTDWVRELEAALATALINQDSLNIKAQNLKRLWYRKIIKASQGSNALCNTTDIQSLNHRDRSSYILHPDSFINSRLQKNAEQNFLTVIIFDQFEEFFFLCRDRSQRQTFYEFLNLCLNAPFVKVIISLREECLPWLLESEYLSPLDAINNNILDKHIRYHLRDFTKREAHRVIQALTKRANFHLEPALIDKLVKDLADESSEVRPIELQVVCSQLQEEGLRGITTLAEYERLGDHPKNQLIEHFINGIIQDCGSPNANAAWDILFALTDEKLARPMKTRSQLIAAIRPDKSTVTPGKFGDNKPSDNHHNFIDIILESGLLLRQHEQTEDRYQLMYDYLVFPIRERYRILAAQRQVEIEKKLQQSLKAKTQAEAAQSESEKQLIHRNRLLKQLLCVSIIATLGLGVSTKIAYQQKRLSYITSLTASSEALFFSNYRFDALLESLKAAQKIKKIKSLSLNANSFHEAEIRVAATLGQGVYGIHEQNRLEGHADIVWDVVYSPTGDMLASASTDNTIRLWTPEGKAIATLTGHNHNVTSLDFSSCGQMLVSASDDHTVKLWSRDGKLLKTFIGHTDRVKSVRFSPDGKMIASAGSDRTIRLWNLQGEIIRTIRFRHTALTWINFSPDGEILAAAANQGDVQFFNQQGRRLMSITHTKNRDSVIYAVNFSPNGQFIATSGTDGTVKLWTRQGELLRTLQVDEDIVFCVSFSGDGRTLATAGSDKTVKVWSWEGELLQTFRGHGDKVTRVRFSPDDRTLASSSYDKTVKLWNLHTNPRATLKSHNDRVLDVSFSPDGQILASGSQDTTVKLWSSSGKLLQTLSGHSDRVSSVSFSPNGEWLATASYDHTVKIWKRLNPQSDLSRNWPSKLQLSKFNGIGVMPKSLFVPSPVATLVGHTDSVMTVTYSPDGEYILTGSKDGTIKLWTADGQFLRTIRGHQEWVNQVSFSPDSRTVISASDDGTLILWKWDPANTMLDRLKTIQAHESYVLGVNFSPDGKVIASAGYDNTVKLWTQEGVLLNTLLKGTSDSVTRVVFSPDGSLVASASYDSHVRIWSAKDGTLLKTLMGHGDSVMSLTFSPDGRTLASASRDHSVILWNLDLDSLVDKACEWVRNYLDHNPNVRDSDRQLCENTYQRS